MEAVAERQRFTFHELENSIKAVFSAMDEAENPDDPSYQAALEAVLAELADAEASKVDALAFVLAQQEAQVEAMKQTEMAIASRRRSIENRIGGLKTYALRVMQVHGLAKIKGQSATFSIRKGSESVMVEDVDALPFGFTRQRLEADKAAIKEALKAGQEVPGAHLVTGPDTLAVRR